MKSIRLNAASMSWEEVKRPASMVETACQKAPALPWDNAVPFSPLPPRQKNTVLPTRLSAEQIRQLEEVHQSKRDVQTIAQSYELIKKGQPIHAGLPGSEFFLFHKNPQVEQRFSSGELAYARGLRYASNEEAHEKSAKGGKSLAKREQDALLNKVSGMTIIATPSTVISTTIRSDLISRMEQPLRPKRKGLPSVIYFEDKRSHRENSSALLQAGIRRPGFGDIKPFNSTKVLISEAFMQTAPHLSHAEKFQVVEKNAQKYLKKEPQTQRFSHSPQQLTADLFALQKKKPKKTLKQNEFFSKLELWDAKVIEQGESIDVAIATMIEMNLAIKAQKQAFAKNGTDDRVFIEHLQRQLSWPQTASDPPKSAATVEKVLAGISAADKRDYLEHLMQHLQTGVTLGRYTLTAEGSSLQTQDFDAFHPQVIQEGIRRFLNNRLHRFDECN